MLLCLLATTGCVRASRATLTPTVGARLERAAELPAQSATGGMQAPAFARACAMRLRDARTGREYQIVRSEVQTTERQADSVTTTTLARAVADYDAVRADAPTGTPSARLRVDCITSRVLTVESPDA